MTKKHYKFKVRFHLGAGKYKGHWQVKQVSNDEVTFIDPLKVNLLLSDCRLVNQQGIANRIYNGKTKSVCAWVLCNSITEDWTAVDDKKFHENYNEIHYNPKLSPHWLTYSKEESQESILDSNTYSHIVSVGKQLYV